MTDRENIQTCHIVRLEGQTPENAVYCNCGTLIGFYTQVGDRVWLQVGALQMHKLHGRCCTCHTEFHYCASDKELEDLLKRCHK